MVHHIHKISQTCLPLLPPQFVDTRHWFTYTSSTCRSPGLPYQNVRRWHTWQHKSVQNPRGKVACFAFFHSFPASDPLDLRHLPGLLGLPGLPVRCCRRRDLLVLACGVSLRLTKGLSQRNRYKEMGEMSGRLECQLHCQMHCRDLNILTVDTLKFMQLYAI